ncbi:hypothetical protein PAAG_12343 [Paracoccidioides lutzii Pb01]|uniref:Uncharacterized protein n=1 Tax=Paracoccidioides lutzii (strain ATCC MYA-826 / Pb01) TaxID=502779 RepID=A0A0A2V485_PARBA|nr:hypothetical protein PAAG_12343 [Paracoccidioides lutzii Pb01]KGQ00970.1 hypothetical protein PAAG_12343 [Paracoccidioides lutzii Pb01]
MPLEHLMFVDCMLTLPGASLEAEYQWRINTINTEVTFCGVEEEWLLCWLTVDDDPYPSIKQQRCLVKNNTEVFLHQAMKYINPPWPAAEVECNVCEGKVLPAKSTLLNHAEEAYGTVVQDHTQEKLALEYQQSLEN